MKLAESVTFGGSGLDRAAHLRADREALARMLDDPATRILPVWRNKPLVRGDAPEMAPVLPGAEILDHAVEPPIFLGLSDGTPWFAVDISGWSPVGQDTDSVGAFVDHSEQSYPGLPSDHRFAELRMIMAGVPARDAELAAVARGIIGWHQTHRFCAKCGAPSAPAEAGWQRRCGTCNAPHFPRTDPVVIMLITRGNSVLMGRSPGWPERMYSLLAGFVEPGETLEAAVRREVFEESGIAVGEVDYLASQPWPFPASMMIGCRGNALAGDITLDPNELEDALWVSREDMLRAYAGDHPDFLPARKGSIANFIIGHWLADRLD